MVHAQSSDRFPNAERQSNSLHTRLVLEYRQHLLRFCPYIRLDIVDFYASVLLTPPTTLLTQHVWMSALILD